MTISTPLVARPIASSHVSHPHVASRPEQAKLWANSSSTIHPSYFTVHNSSTNPLVTRPPASAHVSHSHVAPCSVRSSASSAPSRTSSPSHNNLDISPSPSTPKNTIPAAVPSHFHVTSHSSHPYVAPRSVRFSASSALSGTRPPSYSNIVTSTSTITPCKKRSRRCFVCGGTGRHRLHPRFCPRTAELFAKRLVMFDFTFSLVSFDGSPLPMTRHPGGVAAHLLSPRGSSSRPARVSPRSPSTSPGSSGLNPPHVPRAPVAHHLLNAVPNTVPIAKLNRPRTLHLPVEPPLRVPSPDRHTSKSNPPHVAAAAATRPRTIEPIEDLNPPHHAAVHLRRISSPDPSFESNPPHVPRAPHATPAPVPRRVPDAVPIEDSNHAHASHSSVVSPQPIPVSDHSVESSLPHFPPVERLHSPPIYLPIHVPHPDSKPIVDPPNDDSSPPTTLSIFDILFISPPVRNELRNLIDAMDKSNVGYDIPSSPRLRKIFFRILDQITDLLSSPR